MAEIDILLDTDVVIEITRGSPDAGLWLDKMAGKNIGLPVFVMMEVLMGARSKKEFLEPKGTSNYSFSAATGCVTRCASLYSIAESLRIRLIRTPGAAGTRTVSLQN